MNRARKAHRALWTLALVTGMAFATAIPGSAALAPLADVGASGSLCQNGPTPNGYIGTTISSVGAVGDDGWWYAPGVAVNCRSGTGNRLAIVAIQGDPLGKRLCVPEGAEMAIGADFAYYREPWGTPQPTRSGWILRGSEMHDPCEPGEEPGEPDLPLVTIEGVLKTRVNLGGAERSLAGAYYELMYKGKAGSASDPVEWRNVLAGVDDQGRPSGDKVSGFLGDDGSYELPNFPYPHDYRLRDGSTWYGCPRPAQAVPFLGSHACDPPDAAESALQLRIYPRNRTGSVRVMDLETADLELAEAVDLGLFFERTEEEKTVVSTSPAAFAFGAALTMKESWNRAQPSTHIYLNDDGATHYDPKEGVVLLARSDTGTTHDEHEIAHLFVDQSLYQDGLESADGCDVHYFNRPSNPACAWQEGLADFLAVVAEHRYTGVPWYESNGPHRYDVEHCYKIALGGGPAALCEPGAAVEGRVTALLWDLYDGPDVEVRNGLQDDVGLSYDADILPAIMDAQPKDVNAFIASWPRLERDRVVMFMNTLSIHQLVDAAPRGAVAGSWSSVACPSCRDESYSRSAGGALAKMRWQLTEVERTAKYEIWVRLPEGDAGLDGAATYAIPTAKGVVTVTVDQANAVDGWINLDASGFDLRRRDRTVIELRNSRSPEKSLAADAIILAPLVPGTV